ncbi:hypothetical protein KBD33_03590 [Candidatus Gracilibacteria bacterium]|nr:hypothetical protein [Candidatus Gracilibacteria bacterium]
MRQRRIGNTLGVPPYGRQTVESFLRKSSLTDSNKLTYGREKVTKKDKNQNEDKQYLGVRGWKLFESDDKRGNRGAKANVPQGYFQCDVVAKGQFFHTRNFGYFWLQKYVRENKKRKIYINTIGFIKVHGNQEEDEIRGDGTLYTNTPP